MSRVQDWLSWGAARLSWPGLLGLALLAGGVAIYLAVVEPMDAQVARLQGEARDLARQRARQESFLAPSAQVKDWREDLPGDHQVYGRLTRLFQAAEDAGLALDEGSYRTQFESAPKGQSGLGRLVISLPVSGSYPVVRGFLARALNQDPAIALESLRLTREAMGETELMAELRFSLYLGGHP